MTVMPFVCLGVGFCISLLKLSDKVLKLTDTVINIALVALMLTIGMNMGANEEVMKNLNTIGINCAVISLFAIFFSVAVTIIVEKTILPLEGIKRKLTAINIEASGMTDNMPKEKEKKSPIGLIIPVSIILGVAAGYFLISNKQSGLLKYLLTGSLIILYTGVGISFGNNKKVFNYIRILGFKIIFLSIAVCIGSIVGGALAGILLNLKPQISIISAGGMSYYSLTGAYMTQVFGVTEGTYGFVVNVMREFFTVLLLPFLSKISKGSPIASGAAGNMDTMLMPVTKFVGVELGLVTLITGTVLTFAVPFVLPFLNSLMQ